MSTWYQLRTLDGCTSSILPMREFRDRICTALSIPHIGDLASFAFDPEQEIPKLWKREYEFRSMRIDSEIGRIYEFQEVWPR